MDLLLEEWVAGSETISTRWTILSEYFHSSLLNSQICTECITCFCNKDLSSTWFIFLSHLLFRFWQRCFLNFSKEKVIISVLSNWVLGNGPFWVKSLTTSSQERLVHLKSAFCRKGFSQILVISHRNLIDSQSSLGFFVPQKSSASEDLVDSGVSSEASASFPAKSGCPPSTPSWM